MRCPTCRATIAPGSGQFCSECGAVLAEAPAATTARDRFAAVRAHAAYPAAMEHDPGRGVGIVEFIAPVLMIAFGAVFMTVWMSAAPTGMRVFGVLFGLIWFGALVAFLVRAIQIARAPLTRTVAVVIDERTNVTHHRKDSGASTSYYATLEGEDGGRVEYSVRPQLAGLITRGDIGVGYSKANRLLEFRRIAV
jgi:hypothetical protein